MHLIAQLPVDHLPDPIMPALYYLLTNLQNSLIIWFTVSTLIYYFPVFFNILTFIFSYSIVLGRYFWFKMSSLLPYPCRFICHSFGLSPEVLILAFLFLFSCSLGCVSWVSLHSSVRFSDILSLCVTLMHFYVLTSPLLAFLSAYFCNQIPSHFYGCIRFFSAFALWHWFNSAHSILKYC